MFVSERFTPSLKVEHLALTTRVTLECTPCEHNYDVALINPFPTTVCKIRLPMGPLLML